ncbi:GNAT family N-acetyltransferase [Tianweitania populi]|uniref:N-acetyltransferase n=1 Tax=Tianweitania populi TaxID=1607949 RepID=A0A8J3DNE6_9HYPH|nr:GNAT family N-acetyltransferase [Tianweitania populi]GHD07293.1 N-acetyltransferase [Tianweitania populi]
MTKTPVLNGDFAFATEVPSLEEYMRLRGVAGLTAFSEEAAAIGLKGTVFAAVIRHRDVAIGMGRIIGDGGCFFQITDIAVDPAHQGKGLGKAIMAHLMAYVNEALPATAYVSLIADVPANRLYEQYGFRETAPRSIGMSYIVRR